MRRRSASPTQHVGGLRTVAAFEFLKGLLVLLLSFGLLSLLHKDLAEAAEKLLLHLHLNPDHHFSQIFIHAASRLSDARLWAIALIAFAYSAIRFVEAYGLWHARAWAEWFALISGGLYLPYEVFELLKRPTAIHWAVLITNLLVVVYMGYVRWSEHRKAGNNVAADAGEISCS